MRASGVTAVVDSSAVPYLEGAREALRDGFVSGGTRRNLEWVRPHLLATVDEDELLLLADAQTSGGLLVVGEVPGAPVVGEVVVRRDAVVEVR
jgi:selenide,water dikinase